MSLSEIKSELKKLTPAELAEIESALRELRSIADPVLIATFMGCGRGLMSLKPGWDDDEAPELWETLRDDSSL